MTDNPQPPIDTVVFDIGRVLLDWHPHHLYRKLLPDTAAIDRFLAEAGFEAWNLELDAGRDWDEAVADLGGRFPHHAELISAYHHRWLESVNGAIDGTVKILSALKAQGMPVYAITNFSLPKWELAVETFPFLRWFDGVTVSGRIGLLKPEAAIYRHFLTAFGVDPARAVFIDDSPANVAGSEAVGMRAILFHSPGQLRADLAALGVRV